MPRVLCTLPFASALINGIAFEPADGGMMSAVVTQEVAEGFASIRGYRLLDEPAPALLPPPVETAPAVGLEAVEPPKPAASPIKRGGRATAKDANPA